MGGTHCPKGILLDPWPYTVRVSRLLAPGRSLAHLENVLRTVRGVSWQVAPDVHVVYVRTDSYIRA